MYSVGQDGPQRRRMEDMRTHEFTNRAFIRSHGKNPSGRGAWAFQESVSDMAFDRDLRGDIVWAPFGTLTEARAWVRATQPFGLWAVMP